MEGSPARTPLLPSALTLRRGCFWREGAVEDVDDEGRRSEPREGGAEGGVRGEVGDDAADGPQDRAGGVVEQQDEGLGDARLEHPPPRLGSPGEVAEGARGLNDGFVVGGEEEGRDEGEDLGVLGVREGVERGGRSWGGRR